MKFAFLTTLEHSMLDANNQDYELLGTKVSVNNKISSD